jgi:hypothetical protein
MAAEIIAGLGALKTAFDMAKGLKDIDNAVSRNAAVIELQEKILTAQQAQSTLVERVNELEKTVAGFEKWDTEKEKYDLKEIYPHNFAYEIKPNARGSQPAHLICATCYENGKKVILQSSSYVHLSCPACNTQVQFKDSNSSRINYNRGGWS